MNLCLVSLLGLACAERARAQGAGGLSTGEPLAWELVGTEASAVFEERIDGIAFRLGPTPALDTLYAATGGGVFRFTPDLLGSDYAEWDTLCTSSRCRAAYTTATKEGYLLIGTETRPSSSGGRSTDGGHTWEHGLGLPRSPRSSRAPSPPSAGCGTGSPIPTTAGRAGRHDGPLGAGTRTLSFDTSGLAAGRYAVRVLGPGHALVRWITVLP